MAQLHKPASHQWYTAGDEIFPAMLDAINNTRSSVRLEIYIFRADELGTQFRDALVAAQYRGVEVRVLTDAFGSQSIPAGFWEPLEAAGGATARFNPPLLKRLGFRDHRKMLVCDEQLAFVGGFNISKEYSGDGIKAGWCDLGLRITGPPAAELAAAFDDMFARAEVRHKPFMRFRQSPSRRTIHTETCELMLSGPGRGWNPFYSAFRHDLQRARSVQVISAYFLPTRRLRRAMMRVVRRGGRVQLILAGKSDVLLSQLAARSLYRRLLRAGIEIYEYQPQILHAKLVIVDDTAYVGSSNLDPRSLYLNYELMLRFQDPEMAQGARDCFEHVLANSKRIEPDAWGKARSWWRRFKHRLAYYFIVHVDPLIARWQMGHPSH